MSLLTWSTRNATNVSIAPGIGSVGTDGSLPVAPPKTTTYTLSASGPGGALDPEPTATITVLQRQSPTGSITASPDVVDWGDCSLLRWTTRETTDRFIDPWIGQVAGNGSRSVCPNESTTFVLTGSGPEGVLDPQPSVTITVRPPPERELARCEVASFTAGPPKRISTRWHCEEIYSIDFSIEASSDDAMIADFFRSHTFTDWRVRTRGGRVRHDGTAYWFPYADRFLFHSESDEIQPMTIDACPEGERGMLIACSDSSCRDYPDEGRVVAVRPASAGAIFSVPWGYSTVHEMREGDTFDVPVRYEVRDVLGGTVSLRMEVFASAIWGKRLSRDLEITPNEHLFARNLGRSGEVVFRIHSKADEVDQGLEAFAAHFSFSRLGSDVGGCLVLPNYVQVRITDVE